ncbi:MAG TPA: lysozyme inhibitor LprI family protein, partial [Candidatus Binatus sp.]|uniref:lysozyme inhibitor LprI family protein n=1 Tax=Candidatus Binatus sp. TaxID=2811406 RepID=UPI002F42C679
SSVDLCSDILRGTTPEMDYCTAIGELVSERQFSEMIATTRAGLSSADALILDRVVASFKAYQEADKNRAYLASVGGTIRNMKSMAQAKLLRDDFSGLVEKTIRSRDLEPADNVAFQAADTALNHAYREDLHGNDPAYRKTARSAELHWIKYRDSWTELATSIYSGKKNSLDPGLSMKTAVTKLRTNELVSSEQP